MKEDKFLNELSKIMPNLVYSDGLLNSESIEIPIYFTIDDEGNVNLDLDSMEEEFYIKIKKLKEVLNSYICNKCEKEFLDLNELEQEEYDKYGEFTCSECINKEMDEENVCEVCGTKSKFARFEGSEEKVICDNCLFKIKQEGKI